MTLISSWLLQWAPLPLLPQAPARDLALPPSQVREPASQRTLYGSGSQLVLLQDPDFFIGHQVVTQSDSVKGRPHQERDNCNDKFIGIDINGQYCSAYYKCICHLQL